MANLRLPEDQRNLTPEQVELIDARHRRGQLLLVIGFQALLVTGLLCLWVGQDLTYSPGFHRPIAIWAGLTGLVAVGSMLAGLAMRGGKHEFLSY